ncbi:MAG: GTP pyrophosphokinase [Anaerorhabdus sp.]
MIYTHLIKRAMRLTFDVHKDQIDKSWIPYIYHPIHLAEQKDDENAVIVALKLLTHDDAVDYIDYIKSLSKNEIAGKVKLADLRHNSDLTRLSTVSENDIQRVKKYKEAILVLSNLIVQDLKLKN